MKETSNIRAGEEIDQGRLADYFREEVGLRADSVEVRQFPAGSSNLTYLVRVDDAEFVLRRPPHGNQVKTAHDMSREFKVLSRLSAVYPPAPAPSHFCGDTSFIGSEFYLMERKAGLVIRGEAPEVLRTSREIRTLVCRSFIRNLADLHSLDYEAAGLADFGRPEGYTQRQVVGWSQRYFNAKTDQWDELEESIFWLNNNLPEETGAALVHNDYKFDNIMLDPSDLTKINAVLDWEMATIGSPLMDLGTTLGYWMSPEEGSELLSMPFNPRVLMEDVTRRELVEMYSDSTGREITDILYYYVFGTVKIAAIAQQIYFRFKKGYTSDKRFGGFGRLVSRLGSIAARAIDTGEI